MNDQPNVIITGAPSQVFHAETIPSGVDPAVWAQRCVAHNYHAPLPRYLELHHVIPRAWQAAWRPPTGAGSAPVWDGRTVPLCRTGHGNVHYWIERYMLEIRNALEQNVEPSPVEVSRYVTGSEIGVGRQEHVIARLALERWIDAGGSLSYLTDRRLFGGIYGGETT